MTLSPYHEQYAARSDHDIRERVSIKEHELDLIFADVGKIPQHDGPARVAVLGCADVRYLPYHQAMFELRLWKPTQVTTFDTTAEHLRGGKNVTQHDCTMPLPNPPYDITYAHVLPHFIPTERQAALFLNAFDALRDNGLGMFFMSPTDDQPIPARDYHHRVPFNRWRNLLAEHNIPMIELTMSPKRIVWILKKQVVK